MATDPRNAKLNEQIEVATEIARSENRPTEDVLRDAIAQYRRSRDLEEITSWGAKHSKIKKLKPSDVVREIDKDHAQQNRGR